MKIRKLAIVVVITAGVHGTRLIQAQDGPSQSPIAPAPAAVPVHVSSGAMAGHLISQVQPVYPPGARSGTAMLRAVISKTGSVEDLQWITGAPMLKTAMMDAVTRWKYEPYLVHGEPVEVETVVSITVDFAGSAQSQASTSYEELSDKELFDKGTAEMKNGNEDAELSMAQALLARYPFLQDQKRFRKLPGETQKLLQQAGMRIAMILESQQYFAQTGVHLAKIGNGVSTPQLIHQVYPEFSAEARDEKNLNETVLVNLIVNQQGLPESVHVIRAVGMGLDAQAVKAVTQYRFKPAMENGKPVPVMLNVEVNFQKF